MFLGTGRTSSVTQAVGAPGAGVSAPPKALIVLVNTKAVTPAARRRRPEPRCPRLESESGQFRDKEERGDPS